MHFVRSLGIATLFLASTGCAGAISGYPVGTVYQATKIPNPSIDKVELGGGPKPGDKAGEACATGYLALLALGDASVDAAKKAGQITEVHSVEMTNFNILGIVYSNVCTVVHGK